MNLINLISLKLFKKINSFFQKLVYKEYYVKYNIPKTFRFNGESIKIYGKGHFEVGENSYIGSFSTIQIAEHNTVKIGSYCRISHNVKIYTSTLVADQDFKNYSSLNRITNDVIIEDSVWIGANVFINPGIVIGNNSIVGANSVVTKNIPPNSIYGGVPAKLIRYKSINA